MTARAALALAGAAVLLSGCVAAAVPVVAGGLLLRDRLKPKQARRAAKAKAAGGEGQLQTAQARELMQRIEGAEPVVVRNGQLPPPSVPAGGPAPAPAGSVAELAGRTAVVTDLRALPPPDGVAPGASAAPTAGTAALPAAAGEQAALSIQAYQTLWSHVSARLAQRRAGTPLDSVVPQPGSTFEALRFAPCGDRPPAVAIDIDQSVSPSVAYGTLDPDARWRRWRGDGSDALEAVPGAVDTIAALRREQVAVIFTSARSQASAPAVAAVLDRLGLGPAEPGSTLFLSGADAATAEQNRRAITDRHCVVAVAGDELADFSPLFETVGGDGAMRRNAAVETMAAPLWGAGWFLLPNPIHGTGEPGAQKLTGVN